MVPMSRNLCFSLLWILLLYGIAVSPVPARTRYLTTQEQRNAALIAAIKHNAPNAVRSLLDQGADPNAEGKEFYCYDTPELAPALILALQREDTSEMVVVNLQKSSLSYLPPKVDDRRKTAIVRALLAKGANVNAVEHRSGCTALLLAIQNRYPESALVLLERGADIEAQDHDGHRALMQAAGQPRIWKALLKRGAAVNAADRSGYTPLIQAAAEDDNALMKALLAKGAEVNPKTNVQGTAHLSALDRSLVNGNVEAVRTLLHYGADTLHQSDEETASQLSMAVEQPVLLKLLLAQGWKVHLADESGYTALMYAALIGKVASLKILLAAGADVNGQTITGITALSLAKRAEKPDVVALLRQAGAKE